MTNYMTPNENQVLAILRHAVDTNDIALAERAMRAYNRLKSAERHLDRMAAAYSGPLWDAEKVAR